MVPSMVRVTNPGLHTADSLAQAVAANPPVEKSMNVMEMLANGGPLMIPLGLIFVLALFFFF